MRYPGDVGFLAVTQQRSQFAKQGWGSFRDKCFWSELGAALLAKLARQGLYCFFKNGNDF